MEVYDLLLLLLRIVELARSLVDHRARGGSQGLRVVLR